MANCITRYIPNTLTCLNLFSGCVAAVMAFQFKYDLALLFIIIGAVFDFFDGLAARALNAHSPIGKDLDSLADDICFGLAPSVVVFSLFREMPYPDALAGVSAYFPYLAFLIAAGSGSTRYFDGGRRSSVGIVGDGVPFLMAAGVRDTDVLAEVQGFVVVAQQAALLLPVGVRGFPGCMAGAGLSCLHRVVCAAFHPYGAEVCLNKLLARLL